MRSRILSKLIFGGRVGYFDRAYYVRVLRGTKSEKKNDSI